MVVIAHAIARCASAVTLDFFSAVCKATGGGTGKKRVTTVYISPVTMSNHFTKFSDATESIRIVPHLPLKERHAVIPFFLPFAGCPHRCLFCDQDKQTGRTAKVDTLSFSESLAKLFFNISARKRKEDTASGNEPADLGFYGGTFTLLPVERQMACLRLAAACKARGLVNRVRCSTRPDALDPAHLERLGQAGLDRVEVGVQSFADGSLAASRRGYTGEQALIGCEAVKAAGLELGIQLLPGMPGSTPESFLADVATSLALGPACLRFYPCLVIRDTPLAELWRQGRYAPWETDCAVQTLGRGLAAAWRAGIPVIRLSLAPEPALDAAVLAGPRHPALGAIIQGEALFTTLAEHIRSVGRAPDVVMLPKRCQGFFFGHQGTLRPRWKSLGVDPARVIWTAEKGTLVWNCSNSGNEGG